MSNETIKTYEELTVEQAGELLRDNGWKPVEGMSFKDSPSGESKDNTLGALVGVNFSPTRGTNFFTEVELGYCGFKLCAKVTEIDPCRAPDGCPELEPWMAYVGLLSDQKRQPPLLTMFFSHEPLSNDWMTKGRGGCNNAWPCAIDVRTAWAQEHFPDHCRIRAYIDPVIVQRTAIGMSRDKSLAEECKEKMDRRCGFLPDDPLHMDDRQVSLLAIKLAATTYDLDESLGLGSRIAAYYDVVKQFVKEESK